MKTIKIKSCSEIPDNYTGIVEHANGHKYWFKNGQMHRIDRPAVVYADGHKAWYKNGQRHRLDGPAVEYTYGYKSWYINGKNYTEQDFKMWMEFYRSASGKYYL